MNPKTPPPPLQLSDILTLLESSRQVSIGSDPTTEGDHWSLHAGTSNAVTGHHRFEILYLKANATLDDISTALDTHYKPHVTQVVYPPTLKSKMERYAPQLTGAHWEVSDYLGALVRQETQDYLESIQSLTPRLFVEPEVRTATHSQSASALLNSLKAQDKGGELIVLLGEPGQGKTYLSQHLASQLAGSTVVPIYVSSIQWALMLSANLASLAKTIMNSFQYFDVPIPWLAGQEEQFLNAALRAGSFRVIFDGFDEYILRNEGRITAADVLNELTTLVAQSGAPLVLTSRTSFWKSNVNEGNVSKRVPMTAHTICPFEQKKAIAHFQDRFSPDVVLTNRATNVFGTLVRHDPNFFGRGFILMLVGDLVDGNWNGVPTLPDGTVAMRWFVEAFCEREMERQRLPLDVQQQVSVLERFAGELAQGAEPNSETIYLCLYGEPDLGFSEDEYDRCVGLIESHPLLGKDRDVDRWSWSQEQVGNVFLAQWLCDPSADLSACVGTLSLGGSQLNDLAAMIIQLAPGNDVIPFANALTARFSAAVANSGGVGLRGSTMNALAATVALAAVDRECPPGATRADRGKLLLNVLTARGREFTGIGFSGTIASMDFAGRCFVDCYFDEVVWMNVSFDSETRFVRCHFKGGMAEQSDSLGQCRFETPYGDSRGREFIRSAQLKVGAKEYTRRDLSREMGAVIRQFIRVGGAVRTVEATYLGSRVIGKSRFGRKIVEAIRAQLLERHTISGVSGAGWNVKDDARDSFLDSLNKRDLCS